MFVSSDELQAGQEPLRSEANYMSDRRDFHYGWWLKVIHG